VNPPTDVDWMRRALELAERGRGLVEPNPLVGAVVVRDGVVVGEGWHQRYGQAHAEVNAFAAAGEQVRGATLYVTLEPCCHHGKTPPCTDAVLASGVRRVVAAMLDPFPLVAGKGAAILRDAGIELVSGVCEAEARRLNAPYLTLLGQGRPYVHVKWAMTLDGKIATPRGDSKWISNEASRCVVHQLRGRMDAVLVGVGTALADDPRLTARPPGPRTALRIVLDSRGRLPPDSNLVRTACETPTLAATTASMPPQREEELRRCGCEVLRLPAADDGGVSLRDLLAELGGRRLTNLLVEGGGAVLGAFRDAGWIDEVHCFVAPRLAGGAAAPSPMGGSGVERIAEAVPLSGWEVRTLEGDVYLHGWL
jgi:diaminohydroxyphosphoribosylaminopyrimidine deaminase/5-amino-6-(5-phosphoribosylamino)uracil reductase